ncbi:MAG TPA: glycosyltransferase family 2 protein [Saprospiraceae bacterium]|nr:glycosyltransferase family 2 protein [Saprospiraceae bacterium]
MKEIKSEIDLSIVISLLNEEESLPELEEWIRTVVEREAYDYEILFIDDGSTDQSWSIIKELRDKNPHIRAIKFRRNYGKSAALNEGFQAARGEVVVTMDADLQDNPEEIPALFDMITRERYDLVSGWKKKRYDPIISKNLPSKLFNFVARRVSGLGLHDFNCGLKAYHFPVIKTIEVYGEMHRYIPVMAKWAGFGRITEKVVQHQARKYGSSKFGMERFINGFLDLMSITFVGKFGKRPMHLFGALGLFTFFVGFIILLYLTYIKMFQAEVNIDDRPLFFLGILTLIIGTQLFLTGFLAELLVRNSTERNKYVIETKIGIQE